MSAESWGNDEKKDRTPVRVPLNILKPHEDLDRKRLLQMGESRDWVVRHVGKRDLAKQNDGIPGGILDVEKTYDVAKHDFEFLQVVCGVDIPEYQILKMGKGLGARSESGILIATKKIEGRGVSDDESYFPKEYAPAMVDLYRKLFQYYESKFADALENPESAFISDIGETHQYLLVNREGGDALVLVDMDPYAFDTRMELGFVVNNCRRDIANVRHVYGKEGDILAGIEKEFRSLSERIERSPLFKHR